MKRDKWILYGIWLFAAMLLIIFVPKHRLRKAFLAFFIKQSLTLVFGLLVAEKGLIKYPVRLFKKANKSSFSYEYFFYPASCVLFNLYYPEQKKFWIRAIYNVFYTGLLTGIEALAEKYTNLIKYVKWKWYWSFLTIWLTNYASHLFYRWFFKVGQKN
ncbi:CBO0543 family protein [Robertmurraya sp. 2P01SA]|uniref:CBO0543 family protein n=1 Tax=Robertmurraya TaxID=2837507 RepID=UPI0039A7070F